MTRPFLRPAPAARDAIRADIRRVPAVLRAAAAAAIAAFCLSGCFVARENVLADERLPGGHIRGIRRGETTRQQILERFGPPKAVARKGATMVFPPPGQSRRGRVDAQPEAFFELFSTGRALRDAEVVYYYDSSGLEATGVLVIPLIGGGYHSMDLSGERLWLLVDESTGIVEDYVFRRVE